MIWGAVTTRPAELFDSPRTRAWLGLIALETVLVATYFAVSPGESGPLRYVAYPFVWINAGLWGVLRAAPTVANGWHRLLGLTVASGYFLLLMAVPGNVGIGAVTEWSLRIGWVVPGWGPIVAVSSPLVRLYLVPFEVVGYGTLSYLVYVNALRMARGTLSGALGLVTCVGCTVPVLAPFLGMLGGPAASLSTTAYSWSYDVGTALYLLTLGLLLVTDHRT